ncbi:ethanolamine utilization protein EutJ, partial [Candidatus Woesearchaeota archaeon]
MKKNVSVWIVLLIVVIGAVLVTSMFLGGRVTDEDSVVKIGVSLPLTGEAASIGESALAGITLAVNEVNAEGGIGGKQIELIVEDDQCSPDGVSAIQKLINVDDVTAIIGPVCSPVAGPGLPIAQEKGIPSIIIATAPHLTK